MDPDRWSRIDRIYHQVAALPESDRAAFLAEACGGDRTLLVEIESLLSEDAPGVPFLEEPALAVAARLVADEIPLLTGRMFGPYRIDALLGAGGMGDVYRAHDTVLGRDVAIKILPEAFSDDPARLLRFEQEAQFLASLSHPNVAAIYGVHESESRRGLVLELVDGETLSERITRGPIPLFDAVRIARQIGDGLDAAHQRGIVHRDLKPSNIKIARDGTTKILDFGLAKSAAGEPEGGLAAGTGSYMSPEQARGDFVDKGADIWAFGCVCFEMLTGSPAFRGKTVGGGGSAGPNWSLLPPVVPAAVTDLLKRCLDEDPKRRRRDIGDVLVDLDEGLREKAGPNPKAPRTAWLTAAGVLALLLAATAMLVTREPRRDANPTAVEARLSLLLPPGMDFPDRDNQIAISSDGTMIAYVAASAGEAPRLVLKKLGAESEQIIGDAIDVRDPFFSPNGRWVGFIAGDTIRKVSIADGQTQVVCHAPRGVTASWSHGVILFGEGGDLPAAGIRRVGEDGGPVEIVSLPNGESGERNHTSPQLLPDGRTVIYTVRSIEATGTVHRVVVQTPGSPARVLIDDARFGRYIGNSVLIYQRGRSLFATNLDLETLTTSGPDVMLFNNVVAGRPVWAAGGGVLAYRPQDENRRLVWVSRNGTEVSVPSPPRRYGAPSLSPSGDRVALEINDEGSFDIWMLEFERQSLTRFTSDGASRYPMWTPDGAHVGMARRRENGVFWLASDGGGLRELVRSPSGSWIGSWTPDARRLVYMQENPITRSDLWVVDLQSKSPPRPIVQTKALEYGGRLSPDGRWLSYFSDENRPNQFELYVTAFVPGAPRHRVSNPGAREAVWAKNDSGELFYRDGRQMMSVRVPPGGNSVPSRATVLFEGDYFATGGPGIVNYDVSPDGRRFLMLKPVDADRTPHLTVVQGLDRLIRSRLPPSGR
jgi:eukaryotic-like serine/threonine-protein kinase